MTPESTPILCLAAGVLIGLLLNRPDNSLKPKKHNIFKCPVHRQYESLSMSIREKKRSTGEIEDDILRFFYDNKLHRSIRSYCGTLYAQLNNEKIKT